MRPRKGIRRPGRAARAPGSGRAGRRARESAISATEAARTFSHVLNRVELRGESFLIARGGRPVARIGPASPAHLTGRELAELMRTLPRPDDEYLDVVEHIARRQHVIEPPAWES
jgi:prevent-host-death family protein